MATRMDRAAPDATINWSLNETLWSFLQRLRNRRIRFGRIVPNLLNLIERQEGSSDASFEPADNPNGPCRRGQSTVMMFRGCPG